MGTKGKEPNQPKWEILFPKFFIGEDFDRYGFDYKNLQKKNKGYGSIKDKLTKGIKNIYSGIKKIGKLLFRTLEITVLITALLTLLALAIALSIPWLVIKLISICLKLQEEPHRVDAQEEPVPQQVYRAHELVDLQQGQVVQVPQQVDLDPQLIYYEPQQVAQEEQQDEDFNNSEDSGFTSITGDLSESPSNSNSDNHFLSDNGGSEYSDEGLESDEEEKDQHGSL